MRKNIYRVGGVKAKMKNVVFELDEILDMYVYDDTGSYDIVIDEQIKKNFDEDFGNDIQNETKEQRILRIKRYQKTVNELKVKYNYKCQISSCGYSFPMDNGKGYCEAHHIELLSNNGSQKPENVLILCANHHRMFHYANQNIILDLLLNINSNV